MSTITQIEEMKERGWKVVQDGETITPKEGDRFMVIEGVVTVENQTGGFCKAYSNATLNATNQTGGVCSVYDNATLNATNQTGGDCRAYGNATLNATNQTGGYCRAHHNATLNTTGMGAED